MNISYCSGMSSPEITIAAHCLLNPLTRVKGLSPLPFRPEGPVVQLPCPEALYMGLSRWAVTKDQMDVPQFRRFCRELLISWADLLEMLCRDGAVLRIVGLLAAQAAAFLRRAEATAADAFASKHMSTWPGREYSWRSF